jgi:Na+/citrate or Na+/malate symporter
LREKLKNAWREKYVPWIIAIVWSTLFWEGHRFLPGAKWLSEVIPVWIVILNLAFLFISTTLLISKKDFSLIGMIVTLVVFLVSWILASIGYHRFPIVSSVVGGGVILFNLGLRMWRKKRGQGARSQA